MKYRITNITKKPGYKKGKFKKGFFVDVKPNGKSRLMWHGEWVDVDEITSGILAMQRKEYVSVEPINDLDVQIKEQIEANEAKSKRTIEDATKQIIASKKADLDQAKKEAAEATRPLKEVTAPASGLDKKAMKASVRGGKVNTAKVSGGEDSVDPLGDLENSVNPDGEPNFVVKTNANKKSSKSKK